METFGKASETLAMGPLAALPSQGLLNGPAGRARLEPRVMDLLVYLARHDGVVVTRDAIIRDVWRGTLVTDAVISRSVHQIRKALGEVGGQSAWLETIPKRGYRLAVPAAELAVTPPPARSRPRSPWIVGGIGAAAMLGLISIVSLRFQAQPPALSPAQRAAQGLVVLPIHDTTPASADQALADGLTDELAADLSRLAGLRVIGMQSATRAAARSAEPAAAARELGVGTVLTAVVRRKEARVLLATQLIDVDGHVLAQQVYDAGEQDVASLSASVVHDVARRLDIEVPPAADAAPVPRAAAYRLYLQGRAYALQNRAGAYQEAADYFRQASAEDPQFAAAFAATAMSEMLQVDMGNRGVEDATRAALGPAQQALRLNPQLPEAQAAVGLIALYQGDFKTAGEDLRRATSLRPGYAQAQMWLGRLALAEWQVNRAIASFDRARDLEPLSPIVLLNCGLAQDLAGHWQAAADALERGIAVEPRFANLYWALGHVRWSQGDLAEAQKQYARAIELGADYSTLYAQYAVLLSESGRGGESAPWIARAARMDAGDDWLWIAALTTTSPPTAAGAGAPTHQARDTLLAADLAAEAGDFTRARRLLDEVDLGAESTRQLLHSGWLTEAGHLPLLDIATIYLRSGDAVQGKRLLDEARAYLADLKGRGLDTAGVDYDNAAAAALEGDRSQALMELRSAMSRHWREAGSAAQDPKFASLRGDPQFAALLNP